jgi:hypothetical protein
VSSATFFFGTLAFVAIGSAILIGHLVGMYALGRALAQRGTSRQSAVWGVVLLSAAWLVPCSAALLLPVPAFMRAPVAASVYLLFAWPSGVGYWAGRILRRQDQENRWSKNADDWLAEWECGSPEKRQGGSIWN